MLFPLLLLLSAPAPSPTAATAVRRDDPPVKVWLDQGTYRRGDKAHVSVELGEDGYLVVLRADAFGRVRVLFPLDPGDDAFVRGSEPREIRGRGDREAFSIDEREGSGVVLAARSVTPFKFDEFVRGDHWDYRVLTTRDADDKEQALLDIVQRMAPDGHFDYDAVNYTVASPRAYYDDAYSPYSPSIGLGLGYGFGWPSRFSFSFAVGDPFFFRPFFFRPFFFRPFFFRARCFDPFFFDPFFCDPFVVDPFFFPHRFFFFPRVFVFSRTVMVLRGRTRFFGGMPFHQGLLIDRARPAFRGPFVFAARPPITATDPRPRVPRDRHVATPTRDRRQTTPEPRMPGLAARAPDRGEVPRAWRAPERLHESGFSGWGPAPMLRDRGSSVGGVSGRSFALPSRQGGSLRRGGGGRRH